MHTQKELIYYKDIRKTHQRLNKEILKFISSKNLLQNGRILGLTQNNTLCFQNDAEIAVFSDYSYYQPDDIGKTAVERYVEANPPLKGSLREVVLKAMLQARYSVFEVTEAIPGYGVITKDIIFMDSGFIMDINLSHSATPDLLLAGRILAVDKRFSITSGSMIPLSSKAYDFLRNILTNKYTKIIDGKTIMAPNNIPLMETDLTRYLLSEGLRVEFEDPFKPQKKSSKEKNPPSPIGSPIFVSRNQLCPCGSGKRYKRCCGKNF